MTSVLDMIRGRRQSQTVDVSDLAKRVAAGETPDVDRIIHATAAAGMTDEGFAELVTLCQERAELRRTAAGLEAAERGAAKLQQGLEEAYAAHEKMLEKFHDGIRPLEGKLAEHKQRAATASAALTQLASDSHLPMPLVKHRAAARRRLHDAQTAATAAEKKLRADEHYVAQAHANKQNTAVTISMRDYEADSVLAGADFRITLAKEALQKAEADLAEARAAFDAIDRQCLEF